MGLDLALGLIVLFTAFRGWLQGFINQAVRIAGLVACVYLADPVRQVAKPYVLPHLASIQPDLIDRLLWWTSAAVTYFVLVGVALTIAKMAKKPEAPGVPKGGRNDQFAGFLLGGVKGLLIATFLTAGIEKYALEKLKTMPWAQDQTTGSWALKWNDQYHPAPRIWLSQPVQNLVLLVQRMGIQGPDDSNTPPGGETRDAPQTASHAKAAKSGLGLKIDQKRDKPTTSSVKPFGDD